MEWVQKLTAREKFGGGLFTLLFQSKFTLNTSVTVHAIVPCLKFTRCSVWMHLKNPGISSDFCGVLQICGMKRIEIIYKMSASASVQKCYFGQPMQVKHDDDVSTPLLPASLASDRRMPLHLFLLSHLSVSLKATNVYDELFFRSQCIVSKPLGFFFFW